MNKFELNIGWASLWRIVAIIILVGILFFSRDILIATLLAITISSGLDPMVSFFETRRVPRLLSTLLIYLFLIFGIALIIYIIVPIFLVEFNNLISGGNEAFGSFSENIGISSEIFSSITASINEFIADLSSGSTNLISLLSKFLGGVLGVIIIFVISFYLTLGRDGVERFLTTILPARYHAPVLKIYNHTQKKISAWLVGQLFLSVVIGASVFIGLTALGVKYAFILAVVAAVMELVPFVGPIFSGALAILAALASSIPTAIYTLILFIIIQQLEGHLLIPIVNRYTTNLNPVIVIVALLIGAKIFGIIGIILAVPIAVAIQEIFKYYDLNKKAQKPNSPALPMS